MKARQVIEAESPKQFLRGMAGFYNVAFLNDTCRPWQYAQYDVDAFDEKSAFEAGRAKLVAEVGPRKAQRWKDHEVARYPTRQEAEDPQRVFKNVSLRRQAQKAAQHKCKHGPWETIHSYGAMGHRARCTKCGFQTDFIARE